MVKHPSNGYVNWKVFILAVTAFIGLFSLGWGRQESQAKELKALQMWQSAMDERMGNLIDDEILETVGVVAPPGELGTTIRERYQGLADRLTLYTPFNPGERDEFWKNLITEIKGNS